MAASVWCPGPSSGPASCPHSDFSTCTGGCFWGLELAFQRVPGVLSTSTGYTQGEDPAPNYDSVCSGRTGHTEAVQARLHGLHTCMSSHAADVRADPLLSTCAPHASPANPHNAEVFKSGHPRCPCDTFLCVVAGDL